MGEEAGREGKEGEEAEEEEEEDPTMENQWCPEAGWAPSCAANNIMSKNAFQVREDLLEHLRPSVRPFVRS